MNELTLSTALETALNRIEDMLSDDDGQAFKEARKFLPVGRAALAAQPGSVGEPVTDAVCDALIQAWTLGQYYHGYNYRNDQLGAFKAQETHTKFVALLDKTRESLAAALRDAPQAEGWVMVPKEPTPEMLEAGGLRLLRAGGCHRADAKPDGSDCATADLVYFSMLATRPSAPTAVEPQTIVTERDPHPNAFMQVPQGTEMKAHWPSLVEPDERAMFEAWAGPITALAKENGKYVEVMTSLAWEAWRASKGTK